MSVFVLRKNHTQWLTNTLYNYNITVQKTNLCIEIPCRTGAFKRGFGDGAAGSGLFDTINIHNMSLSLHHSIIEFFYFSSNPKPGAEDQQKQRRRQRDVRESQRSPAHLWQLQLLQPRPHICCCHLRRALRSELDDLKSNFSGHKLWGHALPDDRPNWTGWMWQVQIIGWE